MARGTLQAGAIFAQSFDPATRIWSGPTTVVPSGVHDDLSIAVAPDACVIVSVDGGGSAADIRAYPVVLP